MPRIVQSTLVSRTTKSRREQEMTRWLPHWPAPYAQGISHKPRACCYPRPIVADIVCAPPAHSAPEAAAERSPSAALIAVTSANVSATIARGVRLCYVETSLPAEPLQNDLTNASVPAAAHRSRSSPPRESRTKTSYAPG